MPGGRRWWKRATLAGALLALGLAAALRPGEPAAGPEGPCGGPPSGAPGPAFDLPARQAAVPSLLPAPDLPQPRVPDAPLRIVIDISARRLTLYRDGREVRQFPVAVGKPGWPSPVGEWRVVRKARDWGGGFGTRWLGLDVPWGIYGIHGTNKDWSIGGAESHGCFRMFNRDVEELWDLVPEGTPVTVRGPWDLPFWQAPARPPFRPGGNGQAVVYLQLLLRREGFDPGAADGRYHPGTERAVRDLQRFYGLPEDGVAGRLVLGLLDRREGF